MVFSLSTSLHHSAPAPNYRTVCSTGLKPPKLSPSPQLMTSYTRVTIPLLSTDSLILFETPTPWEGVHTPYRTPSWHVVDPQPQTFFYSFAMEKRRRKRNPNTHKVMVRNHLAVLPWTLPLGPTPARGTRCFHCNGFFFNSSFLTFFSRSFVVTDTIPMSWSSKFLECSFFFTIAIHSSSSNPCFLLYNGQMLQFGQLGRLSLLTISKRLIQKIQIYNLLKIIKKNLFLLDLSTFNSFFFRGCGIIWNRF